MGSSISHVEYACCSGTLKFMFCPYLFRISIVSVIIVLVESRIFGTHIFVSLSFYAIQSIKNYTFSRKTCGVFQ